MITSNDLLQNDSQLEALRAIHECVMNRLARIEHAVEALKIPDERMYWPSYKSGDDLMSLRRPIAVWRELVEAVG